MTPPNTSTGRKIARTTTRVMGYRQSPCIRSIVPPLWDTKVVSPNKDDDKDARGCSDGSDASSEIIRGSESLDKIMLGHLSRTDMFDHPGAVHSFSSLYPPKNTSIAY